MPNHCYQQVHLRGPSHLIHHLHKALSKSDPEFCSTIAPMPFELWAKETQPDQVMPDWYEWRCENWGTKWDVCDVEIDEDGIEYGEDLNNDEEYVPVAWFAFRCWTAWAPPVPVWDRLHAMGIEVEADYQDEGGMFEGAYHHGEDNSWEPDLEEEAV
jgi:hypothetical protein